MHYLSQSTDHSFSMEDFKEIVDTTVKRMRRMKPRFDSIAVRGISGLQIGAPVALRLNVPLLVVRKTTTDCHSSTMVVNWQNMGERVVFLDDFRAFGSTESAVEKAIHREHPIGTHPKVVASYFYGSWGSRFSGFHPTQSQVANDQKIWS